MLFWILIGLTVVIAIAMFAYLEHEGDSDSVPVGFATLLTGGLVVFIYAMFASLLTGITPTETHTESSDLVSFSEYGGGEAGGLYATVGGDSDTVSFVLDGKLMQEEEENVTILTSDRMQVEKVTGKIKHPFLYPWTQEVPDTYTLYLPQTAVDFTDK
jgi:hypothetical protein